MRIQKLRQRLHVCSLVLLLPAVTEVGSAPCFAIIGFLISGDSGPAGAGHMELSGVENAQHRRLRPIMNLEMKKLGVPSRKQTAVNSIPIIIKLNVFYHVYANQLTLKDY